MEQFFVDMLDRIEGLHEHYAQYMAGLSTEQLDWSPADDMNSLCVLAIHVTQAERYWIGLGLDNVIDRDRDAEFIAQGHTLDDLLARFEANRAFYKTAFETISVSQFDEVVKSTLFPDRPFECTRAWAILHALDHTAEHLGHAGMTRQLLDAKS